MTEQALDSDPHLNCATRAPAPAPRAWRAGDLVVDVELRLLARGDARVAAQEIPLRLLCLLFERGGRPVTRRELQRELWPHCDWTSFERNLNTAIRKLRRAVGDDAREPRLIETLRASGYRWIGPAPVPLAAVPRATTERLPDSHEPPRRAPRWSAGAALAAACAAVMLLGAIQLARAPAARSPLLIEVEPSAPASPAVHALAERLRASVGPNGTGDGAPVRVTLAVRAGLPVRAEVDGRGAHLALSLDAAAFGAERLLAEIALRLPTTAGRDDAALPPPAQRAYADAGALIVGSDSIEPVRRAVTLLETVLSVAPAHAGALRMYARAQRQLAVLGRDPRDARERRLLARTALRRAAAADPASASLALDIATHLFWGEGNRAAAAEWFALARREAPRSVDVLHAAAWFALAENRIDDAMQAMDAALAIAPLDVSLHSDLGWFYFRTGRYADALRQCRITLEMNAQDRPAQICEERALAELGRDTEAWAALRAHAPAWLDAGAQRRLEALGAAAAYRAAMHVAAEDRRRHVGAGFDSACLEAIAGDRAAAAADLAAAEALGDPGLRLAGVSPELVRLLGAPETLRLARIEAGRIVSSGSG